MELFWAVAFFVFGLIFGSFLNVCIYRLPRRESIVWPSSHCPVCKTPIRPLDNIPVLSYILLKGKCRQCGAKISLRYPLVELLTGFLFLALFLRFGLQKEIVAFLVLTSLLILITFVDIEYKIILNSVTLPGLILGMFLSWQFCQHNWQQVLFGALLGGGLLIGIALLGEGLFGKESMGMGDVKMAAMIGAFMGPKGVVISIFLSFLIAGIFSGVGMALKRLSRGSYLPFGPFIAAGTLVYLFFGEQIILWYFRAMGIQ